MTYQKALKLWLRLEQRGIPAIMIKHTNGEHSLKKLTRDDGALLVMKKWELNHGFGREKA